MTSRPALEASSAEPDLSAAAKLLRADIAGMTAVRGGGNNGLWRLDLADGRQAALKVYSQKGETRDRLTAEYLAYSFLDRHAPPGWTPRPLGKDSARGLALFEWIAGAPAAHQTGDADCERALGFTALLRELSAHPDARALPEAAEPILCLAAGIEQVERRIAKLAPHAAAEPSLAEFLDRELAPVWEIARERAEAGYRATGLGPSDLVAPERRTISPSDFGFHNAVRPPAGPIVFIDFEYFGWDDPAKLAADFLQHPGMTLSEAQRNRLAEGFSTIFSADETFPARLNALAPLIGLRWCLIMLNEFLPERWRRRILSGGALDQDEAKARQLAKARRRLSIVSSYLTEGGSWH